MTVFSYPCTFAEMSDRQAAEDPKIRRIIDELPHLRKDSWKKVRNLCETQFGKVLHAQSLDESLSLDGRRRLPLEFAVKTMKKDRVLKEPSGIECGRNEIYAARAIDSMNLPCVAKVYGTAQDSEHLYIIMEYCKRGDLCTFAGRCGGLQEENTLREIMTQILTAVAALHDAGIAHRDISLENVLIAEDGSLRLTDFAQAIIVRPQGDRTAREALVPGDVRGSLPGKIGYRAVEVVAGASYRATKLDVFAIGVLFYALVTGKYPFTCAQVDGQLFPPGEASAGRCRPLAAQLKRLGVSQKVSPGVVDLLQQLLAPNPEKRLTAQEALQHPWLVGDPDAVYEMPGADPGGRQEDEDFENTTVGSGGEATNDGDSDSFY